MSEALYWWLSYLRVFALNTPFGVPVKFTIGVTSFEGERVARIWKQTPRPVVDAYGRACLQVQSEDRVFAVEWLVPEPPAPSPSRNPVTWGGKSSADPPRGKKANG
jgi:hypothetical protein